MNTANKISTLRPGQTVLLSESNGSRVFAERSGNGRTIRIVRETALGWKIIASQVA